MKTVNGDIEVGEGSRVDGDIVVEKERGLSMWRSKRTPKVVIGPNAVVTGEMRFEKEVELHVSKQAKVGKIVGATPIRD